MLVIVLMGTQFVISEKNTSCITWKNIVSHHIYSSIYGYLTSRFIIFWRLQNCIIFENFNCLVTDGRMDILYSVIGFCFHTFARKHENKRSCLYHEVFIKSEKISAIILVSRKVTNIICVQKTINVKQAILDHLKY